MKRTTIALLLICTAVFAQQRSTFTDSRDGKKYKTVKIGEQTWMAENLNYNAKGSKCYGESGVVVTGYKYDDVCESDECYGTVITTKLSNKKVQDNCQKYGRLYDWATAMNIDAKFNEKEYGGSDEKHRGICPSGWHIPSEGDWDALMTAVGSNTAGTKLKAASGWYNNGDGTDEFGFSALPGGYGGSGGLFDSVGNYGYWWSSTEDNSGNAYYRGMYYDLSYVGRGSYGNKSSLLSVRCVQD